MSRELAAGTLKEENVGHVDETHFVINYDNRRTLGFIGEEDVLGSMQMRLRRGGYDYACASERWTEFEDRKSLHVVQEPEQGLSSP